MSLVELCPIYRKIMAYEELFNKLDLKEKNGTLYENEDDVNKYIALHENKDGLNQECETWWQDAITGLGMTEEDFQKQFDDFKNTRRKSTTDSSTPSSHFEKIKEWGAYVSSNLWGNGNNKSIGPFYINQLSDYICAPDKIKESWLDKIIIEKINNIDQDIPRSVEYIQPSSELLNIVEKKASQSNTYDKIIEKYFGNLMLEQASTFGADNQMMRCISAGRFYLPDDRKSIHYSDFFKKNYGEKFNLDPEIVAQKPKKAQENKFNANDLLDMVEKVYDKVTADDFRRELLSRGIPSYEFENLNGYDISKIMQDKRQMLNATQVGRSFSAISQGCPDSPYQKQARRIGFMLSIGKTISENYAKDKNISRAINEVNKDLELKIVKSGKNKNSSYKRIWNEIFKEEYPESKVFLTDCLTAYQRIHSDFEKAKMGEYYNRWVETMCQEGNHNLRANDTPSPFEITFHHGVPVKLGQNLDLVMMIDPDNKELTGRNAPHNVKNIKMMIEFKAPESGKLTKHQQEHAKESSKTATLSENPDARFYISSFNTAVEYTNYVEPKSFTALRNISSQEVLHTPLMELQRA